MKSRMLFLSALLAASVAGSAQASDSWFGDGMPSFDEGKLLATGGVSQVEGAGGGGLANWALISGYGTSDGFGINPHYTYINLPDYNLQTPGVAIGYGPVQDAVVPSGVLEPVS